MRFVVVAHYGGRHHAKDTSQKNTASTKRAPHLDLVRIWLHYLSHGLGWRQLQACHLKCS